MDSYSSGKSFGMIMGVLLGVMITLVILRYVNKNRALRTEYDEMQKLTRGEAYMYGFFAIIAAEALISLFESFGPLPADQIVIHFLVILLGVTVQAGYSILHNAYIGLNTQTTRFTVITIVIALINLAVAVLAWVEGRMVVNGILQAPFVNFMVFAMFLILALLGFIKRNTEQGEEQ